MEEPKFKKGDLIKLINTEKTGVVFSEPKIISGKYYYEVYIEDKLRNYSEHSLEIKKIKIRNLEGLNQTEQLVTIKDFRKYLTYIKIEKPLSNNLYAFMSSRTQFEPYQFKPLLKFIQSPYQRLLIADEVGVGKTIEAGIIYTELLSRHDLNNVLILCPSALRFKWQNELRKRFNEDFSILDSKTIKTFFRKYERSPKSYSIKGIASLQMLRNDEILEELERLQIPFDLIIVDEAHHMRNSETRSHRLGRLLASTTEGMVFLSATPLQTNNSDLYNLLSILLPEEFNNFDIFEEQIKPNEYINLAIQKLNRNESKDEILSTLRKVEGTSQHERFRTNANYNLCTRLLSESEEISRENLILLQRKLHELNILSQIYTRTKKKEINIKSPIRSPVTINVDYTKEETEFYNKVSELFLTLNPACPPGFLLQMPQRQVASCIPAARQYLKEMCHDGILDLSKEDTVDDDDEDQEIKFSKNEIHMIQEVLKSSENILEPDSKTTKFLETIKEIVSKKEITKIIIFSFFKRTLKYLEKQLKNIGISVIKIDGDVPFEEREDILREFAKPDGYKILLSSDVGGEGLDMQFCNCMFNYDLPWNPMRIEQRIGRLDRYGQESQKIMIYNFSVEGTIESNIFLRLCNRIGVFEQYIGELEPILGDAIKQLSKEMFNTNLTEEQQIIMIEQVARAVENKKQELEIFDKERSKIIGQDDYFTEQVSNIQKNEMFLTSSEIKNLFETFLIEEYPKTNLEQIGEEEKYLLHMDEQFRDFIRDYLKQDNLTSEQIEKINEIIDKTKVNITFDFQTANANPYLEFITLRHIFIKSVIDHYKETELKYLTNINYVCDDTEEKELLFMIYLLEIKSFTKSLTFVPIAINLKTHEIDEDISNKLLEIIKNSEDSSQHKDLMYDEINACENNVIEYLTKIKVNKEQELKQTNESLINDRIKSLEQSFDNRTKKVEEQLSRFKRNVSENENLQKIIVMKESQKINMQRLFEDKKKKLEEDKKLIVSHEFIAGGILYVRKS
ncbi:MAG: DEAD/DEAH box helicase [Candidatus Woesearchaeota archaeon]